MANDPGYAGELSGDLEAIVRRLSLLWDGPCAIVLHDGPAPLGSSPGSLTLALQAGGQTLGRLELAGDGDRSPAQRAAAEAVADAIAVALLADEQRRAVEKQSRAKDELISLLAHDLRSPLNAITGWCHMLQTGALGPEQRDNAVEIIARNARAQGQLISDVADLSRVLAGHLPVEWTAVDATAAMREALGSAEPQARVKEVTLQVASSTDGPTIWADPDRFTQVARLLLGHSIRVSPKRGHVTAQVSHRKAGVELSIEIAGAGLAADALGALFSEGGEAGASSRPGSLALELARRLVLLQGGRVHAESDGPGTALRLNAVFPCAPSPA